MAILLKVYERAFDDCSFSTSRPRFNFAAQEAADKDQHLRDFDYGARRSSSGW